MVSLGMANQYRLTCQRFIGHTVSGLSTGSQIIWIPGAIAVRDDIDVQDESHPTVGRRTGCLQEDVIARRSCDATAVDDRNLLNSLGLVFIIMCTTKNRRHGFRIAIAWHSDAFEVSLYRWYWRLLLFQLL